MKPTAHPREHRPRRARRARRADRRAHARAGSWAPASTCSIRSRSPPTIPILAPAERHLLAPQRRADARGRPRRAPARRAERRGLPQGRADRRGGRPRQVAPDRGSAGRPRRAPSREGSPAMPIKTDPRFIGRAWITPDEPVVAGRARHVDDHLRGRRLRLRRAGAPQDRLALRLGLGAAAVHRPRGRRVHARCASRAAPPPAVAELAFEPRGQVRPWFKCLVVSIADGSLYPGDRIHVTIGDRSGGGPGSRAQTFRERGCEWRLFVDPFGTELYTVLEASPVLDVVGGGFHRLVAVAPTTVRPGEPFDALVKAEDVWGNPCERFDGEVGARRPRASRACPRASRGGAARSRWPGSPASASPRPARRRASRRATATIACGVQPDPRDRRRRGARRSGATSTARRERRWARARSRSTSPSVATSRCST